VDVLAVEGVSLLDLFDNRKEVEEVRLRRANIEKVGGKPKGGGGGDARGGAGSGGEVLGGGHGHVG
jgi:hypothetical protein